MKYQNITTADMKNGDGLRVVLWVSGCDHHCEGCQNPITWNPDDGLDFDKRTLLELYIELCKDYISGLTISGGDPLYPKNYMTTALICAWVKMEFPEKTIWLYTGYRYEELFEDLDKFMILCFIDVLVDGKFEQDKLDVNYPWAGSTNQRVIDVKETLNNGGKEVVLYESH